MTTLNDTLVCSGSEIPLVDTIPVEKTIPLSWFLTWSQQKSIEYNKLRQQLLATSEQLVKALVGRDTDNPEWEDERKLLNLRIKELERDNAKLQEEVEHLLETNNRLLSDAGNQFFDELDRDNIILRDRVQELELLEHDQHDEIQRLDAELRQVESEKTVLDGEYKGLFDAYKGLEKDKPQMLEEEHRLIEEIDGMKVAMERLQDENEDLKKEKLQEEEQKEQLLEGKVAWEHEKLKLNRGMKRLLDEVEQLEEEKQTLQEEKNLWEKLGHEIEVKRLTNENNELKMENMELQGEKEGKLQQWKSDIEMERSQILREKARLENEKEHLEEMKKNLNDDRQNLEVKMNELLDEQNRLERWENKLSDERLQVWRREMDVQMERTHLQADREALQNWIKGVSDPGNKTPPSSQENAINKPPVFCRIVHTPAPSVTSPLEQLNTNDLDETTSNPVSNGSIEATSSSASNGSAKTTSNIASATPRIPPHLRAPSNSPPYRPENTPVPQQQPKPAFKPPTITMFHGAPHECKPKFIASWILSLEEHGGVNATDNQRIQLARIHLDSLRAYPWFAGYCMKGHGIRDMRKADIYPFSWQKFVSDFKEKWELAEEN